MSKLAASWFGRGTTESSSPRRGYLTLYSYGGPRRRRKTGVGRAVLLSLSAIALGITLAVMVNLLAHGFLAIG